MNIFKINKRDNPFVQVDKNVVMDNRLSWKAKGILMYLLSRPVDWQVYEKEVIRHAQDGRDSVRSGINELIEVGYVTREEKRNHLGQFRGYNYQVYEEPHRSGLSVMGESNNGEPVLTNKEGTNKDLTNKEERYTVSSNGGYIPSYYNSKYKDKFGKEHPTVTKDQLDNIEHMVDAIQGQLDIDDEVMVQTIDKHFAELSEANNGAIFSYLGHNELDTPIRRYADELEH